MFFSSTVAFEFVCKPRTAPVLSKGMKASAAEKKKKLKIE